MLLVMCWHFVAASTKDVKTCIAVNRAWRRQASCANKCCIASRSVFCMYSFSADRSSDLLVRLCEIFCTVVTSSVLLLAVSLSIIGTYGYNFTVIVYTRTCNRVVVNECFWWVCVSLQKPMSLGSMWSVTNVLRTWIEAKRHLSTKSQYVRTRKL